MVLGSNTKATGPTPQTQTQTQTQHSTINIKHQGGGLAQTQHSSTQQST